MIKSAKDASSEVDAQYECLCHIPPVNSEGKVRPEFATELEKFRAACRALSEAIEKFPNRVFIT